MATNRFLRGIFEIVFYVFVLMFSAFLGTFAGFALSGFEESFFSDVIEISTYLGTFTIYQFFLYIALGLIIFPIMNLILIKENEYPVTQEGIGWARIFTVSYLFNPEQSFLWYLFKENKSLKVIKWTTNIFRVLMLALILFTIIGFLQSIFPQLNVVGVPNAVQQVTPASDVVFGSVIPTTAEGGTFYFGLFFLLGLTALFCHWIFKERQTRILAFFIIAILFIAPLSALGWMGYHGITYGNSEASLYATFVFALISAELTILFGIFLFFYAWHLMNNLVLKLLQVSSADIVRLNLGIALFLLIVGYIVFEVIQYKKRQRGKFNYLTD